MGLSTIKLNVSAVLLLVATGAAYARVEAEEVERIVIEDTNEFRHRNGLGATRPQSGLQRTAEDFAAYMARTDNYGHEADGRTPGQRARRQGYDWCRVAENISYQWSSHDFDTEDLARRLVEGWKKSPGHRRNMLDPRVTETAVALARSSRSGRYYAVQLFAQPRGRGGC